MLCAIFGFSTPNLGDDVQALAAALVLPQVDAYVNRDRLDRVSLPQPHHAIMNSWFAVKRYRATPSASVIPYYFGQCVGRPELLNDAWLAEWRKHQPIGVRDLHSVSLLCDHGIEAHFTGCLTMWMGRFIEQPTRRNGVVFLDVPEAMEAFIPEDVRAGAERITNETPKGGDQLARFRQCAMVLDRLRTAEMVVTRRLHAALPCVGFRTPVTVYLEGNEKNRRRFSGSDQIVPVIYHDGKKPIGGPDWIKPRECTPTPVPEAYFKALCDHFNAHAEPRWSSVAEFVESLPDSDRYPRSLWQRLRAA